MAQKFAGIAFLFVEGQQLRLRGNFTVSPSPVERTMIAGQDGVHGYQELPRVPYIEGDISLTPEMRLDMLDGQTDVSVVAQLANGSSYSLIGATCKAALEANSRDGQARVRWEGIWCEEITGGGPPTITEQSNIQTASPFGG
jgi:hypothetical protein